MGNKRSAAPAGGGKSQAQQQPKKRRFGGLIDFIRNVRAELRRVTWPNRDQLQQSTAVVLIIVVALTAFVAFWDFIFQNLARIVFL
ncbi:preprotein translocase subunit SecE [Rubrobacter marinus]|uniref:Protein translocase subunit SecE n=1 Tax=Rubrobacter marinus TaxID=2653852 RepID=A0A6G8PV49_9ACTN|nr:preprotein translocase subunit SecE [Rubrobacter marinus]QIN78067.1 preprotein translocase subunit SecE [Rubrobacter marinus]